MDFTGFSNQSLRIMVLWDLVDELVKTILGFNSFAPDHTTN